MARMIALFDFRLFFRLFSTLLFLTATSGNFYSAFSAISEEVSTSKSLKLISERLKPSSETASVEVSFGSYTNTDQFVFDGKNSKFDSLIFQRKLEKWGERIESDSAVRVDSTLLDIRNFSGVVVLRGLAFHLTKAKSVLLFGGYLPADNGSLILEDCSIFADSLDGSFINWIASISSKIEIRRCFFVAKGATVVSKISLTGGNMVFENNLFNFPGSVSTTVNSKVDFKSNTFNRTQVSLTSAPDAPPPNYSFKENLVAHHGLTATFSTTGFWFAKIIGMNDSEAVIQDNKIYKTWNAFAVQGGLNFTNSVSNKSIDTLKGKSFKELWNWYTPDIDSVTGFAYGSASHPEKFNVFPESSSYVFTLQNVAATAYFQQALFPRVFKAVNLLGTQAPMSLNPDLRFFAPTAGPIHFGPFRVDSISLKKASKDGFPVLLAKDSSGSFLRQPYPQIGIGNSPSLFHNKLLQARYYFLAYLGNTNAGLNVLYTNGLGPHDSLMFNKVDSVGFTYVYENKAVPTLNNNSLRFLNRSIDYKTTAILSDSIIFGSRDSLGAYQTDSIYWVIGASVRNQLVPAKKSTGPNPKYYSKAPAEQDFHAVMVEKLSVPKGGVTFTLAEGTLKAESTNGYQLTYTDAGLPLDTLRYGQFSKVYAFRSRGQGNSDLLTLKLKAKLDQEAFQDSVGFTKPVAAILDSNGFLQITLLKGDSTKGYYLAVKNNILANSIYEGLISEGITLSGFKSSKSAKIKFTTLAKSDSLRNLNLTLSDSAFTSTRFLAGKELHRNGASLTQPWGIAFAVGGINDSAQVEAWASNGLTWTLLSTPKPDLNPGLAGEIRIHNIPVDAKTIMVVERLFPPETYVNDTLNISRDSLKVTVTYKGMAPNKQISHYCLEVKVVNLFGAVESPVCEKKAVGESYIMKSSNTGAYAYRIQYFTEDGSRYGNPPFLAAEGGATWSRTAALPEDLALKRENEWHLIGFPFQGELRNSIVKEDTSLASAQLMKDSGLVDTIKVMNVERSPATKLVVLPDWQKRSFKTGAAFLVGGTRKFKMNMDTSSRFLPLKPYRMALDSGWNLLANPFPTSFSAAKIKSVRRSNPKFWALEIDGVQKNAYQWVATQTLKTPQGYAYFARAKDTLIFDLLADIPVSSKVTASAQLLKVSVASTWAKAQMYLMNQKGEGHIPMLQTPGSNLEIRLGGGAGYLLKNVSDLNAIDEPLDILSPQTGLTDFSLGVLEDSSREPGYSFRLLDLRTGQVYDEKTAKALPIQAGSQSYRLFAGTSIFMDEKLASLRSLAPQFLGLAQNSPNPAQALTQIALEWPAIKTGERNAVLQVLDSRGREVSRIDLKDIQVGRQVLKLDVSTWQAGIYVYRLTVWADGRQTRLQKRMLVTP